MMAKETKGESKLGNISINLAAFILVAILPLVVLYINYSAFKTWRDSSYLEKNGVVVEGLIVESENLSSDAKNHAS